MTREETQARIDVMQHYADGGDVEFYDEEDDTWRGVCFPDWIENLEYRIKPNKTNDILIAELYETLDKIFKP